MPNSSKAARGFSLVELLIVVAIILVIASIAIPNLLRARMAANEASAVESIRTINSAETLYFTTYGTWTDLSTLGPNYNGYPLSVRAGILDGVLGCNQPSFSGALTYCPKSGYMMSVYYSGGASPLFTFISYATPITVGQTGQRAFCSDGGGGIYSNSAGLFQGVVATGATNCQYYPNQLQ